MTGKGRRVHHDERAILFVGTTKGVFVYDGDFDRTKWKRTGPYLPEFAINSIAYDHRDGKSVYIGTAGDGVHRTEDFGRTWSKVGEGGGLPSQSITHIEIGHLSQPDAIVVGLEPAAVAISLDAGHSFTEIAGFRKIASIPEWTAGGNTPFVHSIIVHPESAKMLHAAVEGVGLFWTEDAGETWKSCNEGIPPSYPAKYTHADVHRQVFQVVSNPARSERLYAITRHGAFVTEDGGEAWKEIGHGLASSRGRAITVSPFKPGTIYLVALSGGTDAKPVIEGDIVVCRSMDAGATWDELREGLPHGMGATMHREAMTMDTLDEEGCYFGTSKGELFVSLDDGETWSSIARGLAPVLALEIITEQE